ncbi:hypothetical protein LJC61_02605 [Ruminococcaceae bacterium OttesenSCG-928-A16]|nr:hypothetical protein [Ruminococcaceae bacterium OttesenSCG-928-A16]
MEIKNGKLVGVKPGDKIEGYLDLRGTAIASLPDNLTVGGYLDLRGTAIASLPDNLTVGGYLYLEGTAIASLPDNLTVGGGLYLRGTAITSRKCNKLVDGQYKPNHYFYADGILTHVKGKKTIGKYTFYTGKIKNKNVITDGEIYAHCKTFKDGVKAIEWKLAENRGQEQYSGIDQNKQIPLGEACAMYHVISGACQPGIEQFLQEMENPKDSYSVNEILELTANAYGGTAFAEFFNKEM